MKIRVEYAKKMGREPSKSNNSRYSSGRESPSYSGSRRSRDRHHSPDRYRPRRHSPGNRSYTVNSRYFEVGGTILFVRYDKLRFLGSRLREIIHFDKSGYFVISSSI